MFTFLQQITYGDIILGVSLLTASIGLFLNYFRNVKDSRIKRSEFVMNLFNQFHSDKGLRDSFLKIMNGKFKFDKKKFYSSEDMIEIGLLLELFDNIANLYFMKNIKLNDIENLFLSFLFTNNNTEIKKLFKYLDEQNKLLGINEKAYKNFRNICIVLEKRKTV